MNKKDLAMFKREFKITTKNMIINNIGIYYIGENKEVAVSEIKGFCTPDNMSKGVALSPGCWNQKEEETFLSIAKKTLSGQLGKGIRECRFNKSSSEIIQLLNTVNDSCMNNQKQLNDLIKLITKGYDIDSEYILVLMSCQYNSVVRDSSGRRSTDEDLSLECDEMPFIICSICKVKQSNRGLYVSMETSDESDDNVKYDNKFVKGIDSPVSGFMYPVYTSGNLTENKILIYNKKPAEPDAILTNLLDCEYGLSSDMETAIFNHMLSVGLAKGSRIPVETAIAISTEMKEYIKNHEDDKNPPTLGVEEFSELFKQPGISRVEQESAVFEFTSSAGTDARIDAENLVNASKTTIEGDGISVSLKDDKKYSYQTINGKKCFVIEMDGPVEINGIPALS